MRTPTPTPVFLRDSLLVLVAYAAGMWLFCVPFVGDQKVYISTAVEMREQGSWLHPFLMGQTSYFKPPWVYWSMLAGWKLFGFNLFGTFFPAALATAASAWILSRIGNSLAGGKSSSAAIWFAACAGTLTYGTTAQMEIWIVFFYVLGWWCFLRHFETGRWKWLLAGLVVAGLSALNKSPLYSVFSVLGYWLYLLIQGARGSFLRPSFYLAHVVGVCVGLSWFVAIWLTDRERFWSHYVVQETLSKQGGNGSPPWRMWADFSTFCVPFLLLLVPALARIGRLGRVRQVFLLCYGLIPATFFSYFPYRTETYLFILIPAFALLLDWTLGAQGEGEGALLKVFSRLNGTLVGAAALAGAALLGVTELAALPWVVLLALSGVAFLRLSWKAKVEFRAVALAGLALIVAFRLCAISLGERELEGLRAVARAEPQRAFAYLDPGGNIWHEVGLISTALGKASARFRAIDEAARGLQDGAILVLGPDQHDPAGDIWLGLLAKLGPGAASRLESAVWGRLQRNFAVPTWRDLREVAHPRNRREFRLVWLRK